ncbi:hypothetical protein N7510_008605 [Penicillium lagena]|uniref:uncharacterized protein n=1 Tax=Penicillium lagena TaxID=94218 RepID=UPI0025405FFA|nr:uncharacterized protein N7510_008605 [Penicillium lagena]KAJ5605824.1 hypothetical protein N7510_008605 [Penicillium lagena]
MATNGDAGRGSGSLVDASGYKFSEKDTKPGKIKVKKTSKASAKKKADDAKDGPIDNSPTDSPLPTLDEKLLASFPTGKPREEDLLETVICKHCKRPILKQVAPAHLRDCLKAKQEKARKKKEAREARDREKAVGKDGEDDKADAADDAMKGQKSAKKSAVKGTTEDGTKKGKKRKADADDDKDSKEPKKKKKKDEPKAKAAKPKGPVDVEKQCGVTLPNGAQCARSLTCKSHSMGAKRAVPGRSLPYDMLLQQYQKKNQARQQSTSRSFRSTRLNRFCAIPVDILVPYMVPEEILRISSLVARTSRSKPASNPTPRVPLVLLLPPALPVPNLIFRRNFLEIVLLIIQKSKTRELTCLICVTTEAAIDANAPLQEDLENNGPVDSDEERDSVMAAITRSVPQPLVTHHLITTKKKYKYVRVKEQMLHAMGGRGGGLFSTDDSQPLLGGNIFQSVDTSMASSSPMMPTSDEPGPLPATASDMNKKGPVQAARKTPVAAVS